MILAQTVKTVLAKSMLRMNVLATFLTNASLLLSIAEKGGESAVLLREEDKGQGRCKEVIIVNGTAVHYDDIC